MAGCSMNIFITLRLLKQHNNRHFMHWNDLVFSKNSTLRLPSVAHYTDTFESDPDHEADVESVLQLIIKNRTPFLSMIDKFPFTSWVITMVNAEGDKIT